MINWKGLEEIRRALIQALSKLFLEGFRKPWETLVRIASIPSEIRNGQLQNANLQTSPNYKKVGRIIYSIVNKLSLHAICFALSYRVSVSYVRDTLWNRSGSSAVFWYLKRYTLAQQKTKSVFLSPRALKMTGTQVPTWQTAIYRTPPLFFYEPTCRPKYFVVDQTILLCEPAWL
jgi:hypothetical protein